MGMGSAAGEGPVLFWKFSETWPACGAASENVTRRSGSTVGLLACAVAGAAELLAALGGARTSRPAAAEQMSAEVIAIRVNGVVNGASRDALPRRRSVAQEWSKAMPCPAAALRRRRAAAA
jgi:hypothetical protein